MYILFIEHCFSSFSVLKLKTDWMICLKDMALHDSHIHNHSDTTFYQNLKVAISTLNFKLALFALSYRYFYYALFPNPEYK